MERDFILALRPTDGQAEVTVKFVTEYIGQLVNPYHINWDRLLPLAEFAYNYKTHSSIGMSPFVYQPLSVMDCTLPTSRPTRASLLITHKQATIAEAHEAMATAQLCWHASYDRNRPQTSSQLGIRYASAPEPRPSPFVYRQKRKLVVRYIDPYPIVAVCGPDPTNSSYHQVFACIRNNIPSDLGNISGTTIQHASLVFHQFKLLTDLKDI